MRALIKPLRLPLKSLKTSSTVRGIGCGIPSISFLSPLPNQANFQSIPCFSPSLTVSTYTKITTTSIYPYVKFSNIYVEMKTKMLLGRCQLKEKMGLIEVARCFTGIYERTREEWKRARERF